MPEDNQNQDYPYSNREIREKWSDMSKDIKETLEQAKKTNGLVADINKWRERINGASIVAGLFMTTVVMPILVWSIIVLVNINSTIQESVNKALQAYEIKP